MSPASFYIRLFTHSLHKSLNYNNNDNYRKYKLKIRLKGLGKLKTGSGVAFLYVVIKAPSPFGHTEKKEYERAYRKQQIAYYEILRV